MHYYYSSSKKRRTFLSLEQDSEKNSSRSASRADRIDAGSVIAGSASKWSIQVTLSSFVPFLLYYTSLLKNATNIFVQQNPCPTYKMVVPILLSAYLYCVFVSSLDYTDGELVHSFMVNSM